MEPHNDFGEQEDVACKIIRTGAVGMPSNLIVYSWKQRLAVPWRCTRMASHKSATEWDIDPTNTSPLVRCRLHSCVVDCFRTAIFEANDTCMQGMHAFIRNCLSSWESVNSISRRFPLIEALRCRHLEDKTEHHVKVLFVE
jgi:hypothetical protein